MIAAIYARKSSEQGGPMAQPSDGIYLRVRTWWWLMAAACLLAASPAEAGFDRVAWLELYDSPAKLARETAVAYVYGMTNGFTIAEAIDCAGMELSGNEVAATVAEIVRRGYELKIAVPLALIGIYRCRAAPNSVFESARR